MKLILTIFTFFFMIAAGAQDLSSHQWQDRVLLVISEDVSNDVFKRQLTELIQNKKEMVERKLVIYQITPKAYKKGVENGEWQKGDNAFEKYMKPMSPFRVILLGIDGGEKLNQTEFLHSKDLFVLIDGMPMRRAEINKKRQ